MKKVLAILCALTCIFGMTACGNETISAKDTAGAEMAKLISTELVIPYMSNFADDEMADRYLAEYNKDELQYIMEDTIYGWLYASGSQIHVYVDGSAVLSGITSFNSAFDSIGEITELGEPTAKVTEKEIIISVPVMGTLKDATGEFIYSNDLFLTLNAIALNPNDTMGDAMTKAGLNTLLGMGTVFAVLILISLIISALGVIPKLQAKSKRKDDKVEKAGVATENVSTAVPQIVEKEELSDDLELVAVIAAAIAAYEGATSTDGFVVRSIRRVRR
ncbi:MAG: hypothetical protein E7293_00970 [Lachnospiraceae bacterium]|nr:hypothetical protein [Lachnospiraceae bacterium]